MIKKVLFIGYGTISEGIIRNIKNKTEIEVVVYSKKKIHIQQDIIISSDLNKLLKKKIDIIISCVPNDEISFKIWHNPIIKSYISAYNIYCIEMSTLSYKYILNWHAYIKEIGGKAAEIPFTGSKKGSEEGTLSLFISSNYYKELKSFLKIFSKNIYVFADKGEAIKFKLIYNLWGACYLYVFAVFYHIINNIFPNNEMIWKIFINDGWMAPVCTSIFSRVKNKNYENVNFKLKYMATDLEYAKKILNKNQDDMLELIFKFFKNNTSSQNENLDFSVISESYGKKENEFKQNHKQKKQKPIQME